MAWRFICDMDEIADHSLKEFEVDEVSILVARAGEEYFAYPPLCPHQEEPLRKGACDGAILTCFKHLWQWDMRTGAPVGSEAKRPLKMYRTKCDDGKVYVFLDVVLDYEYSD